MANLRGLAPEVREEAYRRRAHAAKLRREGHTWDEVAAMAGYNDRSAAHTAVKRLLKEHQSLAYDEIGLYRQESLDRLTALLKVAMEKALTGDEKMMIQARLLISQMDDLTGSKAPVKLDWEESDVDRLLREAVEEHRRRAERGDREADGAQAGQAADG